MLWPETIPYLDLGNSGPVLHFAHANGYPPDAYDPLLERLSKHFHILAMRMRPLWPGADPKTISDLRPFAKDLATFLDQHKLHTLPGIGHSFGATATLRLALQQPDRFSALVLIDPVLYPPLMIMQWDLIYRLGLAYQLHPLVGRTLRRRRVFESKAAMFDSYRTKPVFSHLDNQALHSLVRALVYSRPDGKVELVYSPEWEARIYATGLRTDMEIWRKLPSLKPPLLVIRGENTNTFWESTTYLFQRKLSRTRIITVPSSTHLVPLEKPDAVHQEIMTFLHAYI